MSSPRDHSDPSDRNDDAGRGSGSGVESGFGSLGSTPAAVSAQASIRALRRAFVAAPVASPCTGVCRIDAQAGWCEGCLRTLDEIVAWSTLDEAARQRVCDALPLRQRAAQKPRP